MVLGVVGCRAIVGFHDAVELPSESAGGAPTETGGAPNQLGGAPNQPGGAPNQPGGAPTTTGGAINVSEVLVIDDFEDGNLDLKLPNSGTWQIYDDNQGPGITLAADNEGHDSDFSMRIRGGPQTAWGASVLGPFRGILVPVGTYFDASDYDGLQMWVQDASGTGSSIGVGVGDWTTEEEGGICTVCFDRFLTDVAAGSEWKLLQIRWEDLAQEGFGAPQNDSPATTEVVLIGMAFYENVAYDIRIDDVAFFAE